MVFVAASISGAVTSFGRDISTGLLSLLGSISTDHLQGARYHRSPSTASYIYIYTKNIYIYHLPRPTRRIGCLPCEKHAAFSQFLSFLPFLLSILFHFHSFLYYHRDWPQATARC
jgi:hypothetical protein